MGLGRVAGSADYPLSLRGSRAVLFLRDAGLDAL